MPTAHRIGSPASVFISAKPIWPTGQEREMNLFVGFRAVFSAPSDARPVLRVTASTVYRAFLNGEFIGYGPARGPHGWFRMDEWDLTPRLRRGRNLLAIEVAGYNVNSYYLLDQPSFLQAEVLAGEKVLASTGGQGATLVAIMLPHRLRKVSRYSFQRPFSECYQLAPDAEAWRSNFRASLPVVPSSVQPAKRVLPRGVPYPYFHCRQPVIHLAWGKIRRGITPAKLRTIPLYAPLGSRKLRGFTEEQFEARPLVELQHIEAMPPAIKPQPYSPSEALSLTTNSYHLLDFGTNLTGFIGAKVTCRRPTQLFLVFDEILTDGEVDFLRLGCVNVVRYELAPGKYDLESFEPYTLRYLKIITLDGTCTVSDIRLREYTCPDVWRAYFAASDERLNRIFAAARETFRQNALDVFMDCPARERAGWLCDSFFTARAAFDLCGNTAIERNFFENFLLPQRFRYLPPGMLPMCYPADHNNGSFIPNWALWFVVQLEEYLARSGDRAMVEALAPKVEKLFQYFRRFRNADGLLERLKGWIFVEWSKANSFVQDVNYPTNMLYAAALAAAGRMYQRKDLLREAECVRAAIRAQSFRGRFFADNAVRNRGRLLVTDNYTEACQYYAFYFDVASPLTHRRLWRLLCEQFGPQRTKTGKFPKVDPANSFVGNMLRLELLSRYGECCRILDEVVDFFLYMADRTGTLWEHVDTRGSCNHGFASHAVRTLYRDILGLFQVDPTNKRVWLRFTDLPLQWCEGRIPVPDGFLSLAWRRRRRWLEYHLAMPAAWTATVENCSGLPLRHAP